MRIISKFKDYYDGGAAFGVDMELMYVRKTEIIESFKQSIYLYDFHVIGFCGEIYPIVNYSQRGVDQKWERSPKKYILYGEDTIKYTFDNEQKWKRGYGHIGDADKYHKVKAQTTFGWPFKSRAELFKEISQSNRFKEIFLEYQVPIFFYGSVDTEISDKNQLVLNPNLKNLAFYKVMDTIQAFQQISMFMSNVLVFDPQGDIPTGDDIVLRDSKGFNKFSFRKDPGQKKRRKNK